MNKTTKIIISLAIIPITIFIIYGNKKICTKTNETLKNGYCEKKRTIYTEGKCPIGYFFYQSSHTCQKVITSLYPNYNSYTETTDYECPFGFKKNEYKYHAHMPGYYECCYKDMIDKNKAKSRFYHWFN